MTEEGPWERTGRFFTSPDHETLEGNFHSRLIFIVSQDICGLHRRRKECMSQGWRLCDWTGNQDTRVPFPSLSQWESGEDAMHLKTIVFRCLDVSPFWRTFASSTGPEEDPTSDSGISGAGADHRWRALCASLPSWWGGLSPGHLLWMGTSALLQLAPRKPSFSYFSIELVQGSVESWPFSFALGRGVVTF